MSIILIWIRIFSIAEAIDLKRLSAFPAESTVAFTRNDECRGADA
jgi:hypothetical protein